MKPSLRAFEHCMSDISAEYETYKQRSFFQIGMPLFVPALFFLLAAFGCCLRRDSLLLAVILLILGLLLMLWGVRNVKEESKHILRFVREKSTFSHRCDPPLTIANLLDDFKQEGFEITEYPFGNYYGRQCIRGKFICHLFIANNETPDCPEAERYSKLFIQTVCESGMALGSQYLLDLEYGPDLEEKAPSYIQSAKEGFMHNKQGVFFGFRLAYDTQKHILYCAEAVIHIIWQKNEVLSIYASELLKKLFFA